MPPCLCLCPVEGPRRIPTLIACRRHRRGKLQNTHTHRGKKGELSSPWLLMFSTLKWNWPGDPGLIPGSSNSNDVFVLSTQWSLCLSLSVFDSLKLLADVSKTQNGTGWDTRVRFSAASRNVFVLSTQWSLCKCVSVFYSLQLLKMCFYVAMISWFNVYRRTGTYFLHLLTGCSL